MTSDQSGSSNPRAMIPSLLKRPFRLILPFLLLYLGVAIFYTSLRYQDGDFLFAFLSRYGPAFLGIVLVIAGLSWGAAEFRKSRLPREYRFIDVDSPPRHKKNERWMIRELKERPTDIDYDKFAELVQASVQAERAESEADLSSFSNYFGALAAVLEKKADIADKKASILLDRGVGYTKFGIFFFLAAIIAWQALAWKAGFKQQHIYGAVSCSLLFIFIEFLSAWFLRQYRHFVDTSTYLIKVKSIFDKYMLTYLVAREFPADGQSGKSKAEAVLSILAQEISWPDRLIFDGKDLSFAKESMEAMADLVRSTTALRKPAKGSATAKE